MRHLLAIWAVGGYHGALAGGHALFWIEWVSGARIEGAGWGGLIDGAMGLVGVLDDGD